MSAPTSRATTPDPAPAERAGDLGSFGEDDAADRTVITSLPFSLEARFTGRGKTMDALDAGARRALAGDGLFFPVVVADAGLGKSRVLGEFVRRLRAAHPTVRVYAGVADEALPYGPIGRALAARFGLVAGESDEASRERIVAGLGEVLPASRVVEVAHLLAHTLRVPYPESPVVGPLVESPQRLESRVFMALRRFLAAEAEAGPLVIALEDLDQVGADTVKLVHYLAAGLARAPVILAGTATAALFERHPAFGEGDVAAERIDLAALDDADAEGLARALLAPVDEVPPAILAHARALGGSPRAIHELVRLLLESGCLVRADNIRWRVDGARLAQTTLPDTYDQLIATRLAVMDVGERRVLEMAAVIGPTAWIDAMIAIDRTQASTSRDPDGPTLAQIAETQDRSRAAIGTAVATLVEREWLVDVASSSLPGERELRFAYPHLRDLVYGGIEDGRRRSYHATVARWLELRADAGARGPSAPDGIARHLERAGLARAAADRYRQAAEAARARFANDLAIRCFDRALACIGDADLAARISLWHDLGSVYELIGDFEAALGAFERMLRLSWLAASKPKAAVAFNKMGRVWRRKGDLALALEYLERGLELFTAADDARGIASSLDDVGKTLHLRGDYDAAHAKITEALARRGAGGDPRSIAASLSNLGAVQHDRGQFENAATCHLEALELRRRAGDRSGVVVSLNNLAVLAFELGDLADARAKWLAALADAEAMGALPMCALCLTNLGELALREGKPEEARSRLENALEIIEDIEDRQLETEVCRLLALLESRAGQAAAARALAERALAVAAKAGLREKEAQAHLCLGEIRAASLYDAASDDVAIDGREAPAVRHYRRAEALLREIGNRTELAKVLDAFGRHLVEQGELAAGRARLTEAKATFVELGLGRYAEPIDQLLRTLG